MSVELRYFSVYLTHCNIEYVKWGVSGGFVALI